MSPTHGYCQCGCGEKTRLAPHTNRERGWKKGEPISYIRGHNGRLPDVGWECDPGTGCWNWARFVDENGYPRRREGANGGYAHRVAYREAHGEIPEGYVVHHKCRNRRCVNPAHLELMEKREHARQHREEQGSPVKPQLTAEQVRELRQAPRKYGEQSRLARAWGVSVKTVNHALHGQTYAWVK